MNANNEETKKVMLVSRGRGAEVFYIDGDAYLGMGIDLMRQSDMFETSIQYRERVGAISDMRVSMMFEEFVEDRGRRRREDHGDKRERSRAANKITRKSRRQTNWFGN